MNEAQMIRSLIRARHPSVKAGAAIGLRSLSTHTTKSVEENGAIEVEVLATTEGIDLDNEVVVADGMDVSYLDRNKSIFTDHQYGLGDLAGKLRWIKRVPATKTTAAGWKMRVRLLKSSPYYPMLVELAETDTIGASIGMEAVDVGPPTDEERKSYPNARSIIRKARALEVSFTAMPMNVECQSDAVYRDQKSAERLCIAINDGRVTSFKGPRRIIVVPSRGYPVSNN